MPQCPQCGHKNAKTADFCVKCAAPLVEGKDPFVGMVIDRRYEVTARIAEGGMGTIYRARDVRLEKDIALKILHRELARDKKFLARFRNEAVTVAQLKHPNIALVYDTGPVRDTYFIAMDFVEGEDLADFVKHRGPLPVDEAFSIAAQVAEGLAYAHERGILHRDIKPGNIIVDRSGKAVITDFGIAKALGEKGQTTTGTAVGTPEYMSLEQVKGRELDARTDVYSLGVVLYEMLTGKSPFRGDTGISSVAMILSEEAEPIERLRPDLPGWALEAVTRAMAKDRDERFGSALEFLEAVREESVEAPAAAPKRVKKARTKSRSPISPSLRKPVAGELPTSPGAESTPRAEKLTQDKKIAVGIISALIVVGISIAFIPLIQQCSDLTKIDKSRQLRSGLLLVQVGNKWGYADGLYDIPGMKGDYAKIIIEPRFDEASDFNEGLALVKVGKKYGFIDRSGRYVVEPRFDEVGNFVGDIARVKVGNRYGYIDKNGKYIAEPSYDWISDFSDGIARVKIGDKYGYIDRNAKTVAYPQFDDASEFRENLARVKIENKYGYINKLGEYAIKPRFDAAGDFQGGRARVENGGKWWYIGINGETLPSECRSSGSSAWGYLSGPGDSCEFTIDLGQQKKRDFNFDIPTDPGIDFRVKILFSDRSLDKVWDLRKNRSLNGKGTYIAIIFSNSGSGDWKCTW